MFECQIRRHQSCGMYFMMDTTVVLIFVLISCVKDENTETVFARIVVDSSEYWELSLVRTIQFRSD